VVAVEVRGVVLLLKHSFAEEHKGRGDGEAVGRLPLLLDSEEGFPRQLSGKAVHEAVLSGFRESLLAAFAGGLDSHRLKPSAHRQTVVEG
jgi:hypothetical protein